MSAVNDMRKALKKIEIAYAICEEDKTLGILLEAQEILKASILYNEDDLR
jgi:hypothetical protein